MWDTSSSQERVIVTWTLAAPRSTVSPPSNPREKGSLTQQQAVVAVRSSAKSPLVAMSLEPLAISSAQSASRLEGLQKPLPRDFLHDQTGPSPSFLGEAGGPFSRYLIVSPNAVQSVAGSPAKTLHLSLKP